MQKAYCLSVVFLFEKRVWHRQEFVIVISNGNNRVWLLERITKRDLHLISPHNLSETGGGDIVLIYHQILRSSIQRII